MLEKHILSSVRQRLQSLTLPVNVRLWNGESFLSGDSAKVTVRVRSAKTAAALATPTLGELARAYVEQEIDIDGEIRDVISAIEALGGAMSREKCQSGTHFGRWRRNHERERKDIGYHYDVSNEFYALWLDARRVYSCAYFRRPEDSLDVAQEQKLDHICRKLDLRAGERFLDIGCGWGALILWAVERYGVHAVGITLSQNQLDYARELIRDRGIADRCEVRLLNYRDLPESAQFDKIASVGMFEHVGEKNLPLYFTKIYQALKPGGWVLNHGITSATFEGEQLSGGVGDFVERYVFPGGELTHLSNVIELMARQGLECWDIESLRPHYAKTLWHWVDRLDARADQARALVGEKRYRIWRIYMAGFAHAFEHGWESVFQILGGKPLSDGTLLRPLTREYMYRNEA
jgi:cyclopropane-fatty-acyl-phospholipid synthase